MANHPELKTLIDFIRYATSSFNQADLYYGHGTDNAWDEAVALVFHTLHLPHHLNPIAYQATLIQPERTIIFDLINQRVTQRIPLPYLTHEAWFAGYPFYVDERVLIPRSSLAELILHHFEPWIKPEQIHDILDLCTGSGSIAIACAKEFPEAKIDASDISPHALTVTNINILRHQVEDQVNIFESDLFEQLPSKKYDIIISNPPYVSIEEMQDLPLEYKHEPAIGLEAGQLGLDFVIRILKAAKDYLTPQGILIVEVGNSEQALITKYPNVPFTWIEFEHGEGGVFLLTAEELTMYHDQFMVD